MTNDDPYPNATEYLQALGGVVLTWSALESMIELTIWMLADVKAHHGACMTSHLGATAKLHALGSLARLRITYEPGIGAYVKLEERIEKAIQDRNRVLHSEWDVKEATWTRIRTQARRKLTTSEATMSIHELTRIGHEISELCTDLMKFQDDHVFSLSPLRGISE